MAGGLSLRVTGIDQVTKNLGHIAQRVDRAISKATVIISVEMHRYIVNSIQHNQSKGRTYKYFLYTDSDGDLRRGRPRNQPHVASRPGDAPNTDMGDLVRGIRVTRVEQTGPFRYRAKVVSQDGKSAWLEYGTINMEARPFMRPALLEFKDKAIKTLQREVSRVL